MNIRNRKNALLISFGCFLAMIFPAWKVGWIAGSALLGVWMYTISYLYNVEFNELEAEVRESSLAFAVLGGIILIAGYLLSSYY